MGSEMCIRDRYSAKPIPTLYHPLTSGEQRKAELFRTSGTFPGNHFVFHKVGLTCKKYHLSEAFPDKGTFIYIATSRLPRVLCVRILCTTLSKRLSAMKRHITTMCLLRGDSRLDIVRMESAVGELTPFGPSSPSNCVRIVFFESCTYPKR